MSRDGEMNEGPRVRECRPEICVMHAREVGEQDLANACCPGCCLFKAQLLHFVVKTRYQQPESQ